MCGWLSAKAGRMHHRHRHGVAGCGCHKRVLGHPAPRSQHTVSYALAIAALFSISTWVLNIARLPNDSFHAATAFFAYFFLLLSCLFSFLILLVVFCLRASCAVYLLFIFRVLFFFARIYFPQNNYFKDHWKKFVKPHPIKFA